MLPDKTTKCHRTGFQETCFKCVTEHGCKLWKRVSLVVDRHPETAEPISPEHYDCMDSLAELFWKDMLRRQVQTTATVDNLRKEVREGNDQSMIGTLARLNQKIDAEYTKAVESSVPPKLLEG